MSSVLGVNFDRVAGQIDRELIDFEATHPSSRELYNRNLKCWLYGVPLHWMSHWPASYPIFVSEAKGATVVDVDGHTYVDFALGDTGAMFGHSNPAVVKAIAERVAKGSTLMLPTEDSAWVGEELTRRFGLTCWQATTSASEANRGVIRLCRTITKRDKVVVFNGNYVGSVDESQVELDSSGRMVPKRGVYANAMQHENTSRMVEFNDLSAVEKALSHEDVACVLTEPVMTNIGMVPPVKGFHEGLRNLTRKHDVPLIIDETHTISYGPSGYSRPNGLRPDFLVLGKSLAGGIPVAVFGATEAMAERIRGSLPEFRVGDPPATFGFGTTLSGSAIQMAAMRATLSEVMTESNYTYMLSLAEKLEKAINSVISSRSLPWHVTRIGTRLEYLFMPSPPLNGGQARRARNSRLEALIHLYCLNRGVLLTPFHNMALVCPATTSDDTDRYARLLEECVYSLRR